MSFDRALAGYFGLGLLFGAGLILAGMADPAKVLNFLDLAAIGRGWDGSLALVLGAAVAVTFAGYRLAWRRQAPLAAPAFAPVPRAGVDSRLVAGAAIFGLGWGLVGFCPGPALVALGTGNPDAALFVAAMLVGMVLARTVLAGPAATRAT